MQGDFPPLLARNAEVLPSGTASQGRHPVTALHTDNRGVSVSGLPLDVEV